VSIAWQVRYVADKVAVSLSPDRQFMFSTSSRGSMLKQGHNRLSVKMMLLRYRGKDSQWLAGLAALVTE